MYESSQNNYITFGNIPLARCVTQQEDGHLSCDITGSIKEKEQSEPNFKDVINVKLSLSWNSPYNSTDNTPTRYLKYSFMLQDIYKLIHDFKQNNSSIIQSLNLPESETSFKFTYQNFVYTKLSVTFFAGVTKLILVDIYDINKILTIHIPMNEFMIIYHAFEYYHDNYISIYNMIMNKYYDQFNYNKINSIVNKLSVILDSNKEFYNKMDYMSKKLSDFIVVLNKKTKDFDFSKSLNSDVSKLVIPQDNYESDIKNQLEVSNMNPLEENIIEIDKPKDQVDLIDSGDIQNKSETTLEASFDNFFDNKEEVIKQSRMNLELEVSKDVKDESIKNNIEYMEEQEKESNLKKTLPLQLTKYFKTVDYFRNFISLIYVESTTYEEMLTKFLSQINSGYALKDFQNQKNYSEFNKYMTYIIYTYIKHGIQNGFLNESDPMLFMNIDGKISKDIYKVLSFVYINLVYFNSIKSILVSNNVDPISGIKDDRKCCSLIKLILSSWLFSYYMNNEFDRTKFESYIKITINQLSDDKYFECDLVNKQLRIYNCNFDQFTDENFYINILNIWDDIKNNIQSDYSGDWKRYLMNISEEVYNIDLQEMNQIIAQESVDKIKDSINQKLMNTIIIKFFKDSNLDKPWFHDLLYLIMNISNNYKDMFQYDQSKHINWDELPVELLKAIIIYEPLVDSRLKFDYNYFQKKIQDCYYSKNECLQLLYSALDEQNTNNANNIGNQFVNFV